MEKVFPGGVWPVMLTPFTASREVDYEALQRLVDWYIDNGADGLFAVCQSSEMFFLTLEERVKLTQAVIRASAGRVPVIASGHVADCIQDQITEVNAITKAGPEAVIFITNRFAKEGESDGIWIDNCRRLMERVDPDMPLGLYECPYPYKRVLSEQVIQFCLDSGRFYFIKDTCCDQKRIDRRLKLTKGSRLKLYNANTTTLLDSLRHGAAGYSGVMANFHPGLYKWLCDHSERPEAEALSGCLTILSLFERQWYPVNAKYYLRTFERVDMETVSRKQDRAGLTDTYKLELEMLLRMTRELEKNYLRRNIL